MKHVVISLITYKNHETTVLCLKSLEKMQTDELTVSILVVNNDTEKDFSYEWKKEGDFQIINHKNNSGFAGGHNISLAYALEKRADYVLVLNNDTYHDPHFLTHLVEAAEKHKTGGVFGPKIYFAEGHEFHKNKYTEHEKGRVLWYAGGEIDWENMLLTHRGVDVVDDGTYDEVDETDFVSGCCMLLRTEAIRATGVFDERYFLYLEDSDLNMRIKKAGYGIYFVPSSFIWHENAGSTGGSGSSLQDYFITRNRLLFGYTYAPLRTKIALCRENIRLLLRGRMWQKRGIIDYYRKRFGKGSFHL